jgi:hypothetical protein
VRKGGGEETHVDARLGSGARRGLDDQQHVACRWKWRVCVVQNIRLRVIGLRLDLRSNQLVRAIA